MSFKLILWTAALPLVACSTNGTDTTHQALGTTTCCYATCADDTEAELRSLVAEAKAEQALAEADAARHHTRVDELKGDLQKAKDALEKIPTDQKLYFKITANTISLGLELNGVRQFAKGKQVEKKLGFLVCEADIATATLKVKEATKTVWEKPTLKEAGVAAVKVGTGTTIQVLTADGDDWTAKIPVYGAIATIAKSGGELYAVGELREATQGFVDVMTKAVAAEEKKEAAANVEAAAAKKRAEDAQKKLDEYLKNKQDGICPVDETQVSLTPVAGTTEDTGVVAPSSEPVAMGYVDGDLTTTDTTTEEPPLCEGDGDSIYLEYESLSDEQTTGVDNFCETEGCPDSGWLEFCAIFGCDGFYGP